MVLANPMRVVLGQQGAGSEGTPTQIHLDREMGNANQGCMSDRSQVVEGKLLIGQLAPWVTWDI